MKKVDKLIASCCIIEGSPSISKTKVFITFGIFYLECRFYILKTRSTNAWTDLIVEQLSELTNNFLALNLNLLFWVY